VRQIQDWKMDSQSNGR